MAQKDPDIPCEETAKFEVLKGLAAHEQPRESLSFQHIPEGSPLEYVLIFVGTLLVAMGSYFFKFPNQFVTGGVTGIATVVSGIIPELSPSYLTSVLNVILLVLGFLVFGRDFGTKTTVSTLLFSAMLWFFETFIPLTGPLTNQKFMELCFAIFLPAAGAAILFNVGASSGGTDIIAMIIRRWGGGEIGTALLLSDALITASTFLVFTPETALMSVFGMFAKSNMVDSVIESMNLSKYFTIITSKPEEVTAIITGFMKRSGTKIKGEGLYTGQERTVILCVVSKIQAIILRDAIRKCDPSAFIMITNTSQIVGKGFRGMNF